MWGDFYTITELAAACRVTTKTILRWEKKGVISKAKRNFQGWRTYNKAEFYEIVLKAGRRIE